MALVLQRCAPQLPPLFVIWDYNRGAAIYRDELTGPVQPARPYAHQALRGHSLGKIGPAAAPWPSPSSPNKAGRAETSQHTAPR